MEVRDKSEGITNFLPSYGQNQINYSRVLNYASATSSASTYGIKFVESGKENYIIKNKLHVVKENQFLLVNKGQDFCCEVKEKNTVYGFCLNLDEDLLRKVYYQMIHSEEDLIDNPDLVEKGNLAFYETVYPGSDIFTRFLTKIIGRIRVEKDLSFIDIYGFYHDAGYQLLLSQRSAQRQIKKIKASKNSTRKEVFNRLNIAKAVIDADISSQLTISSLSKQSGLSEFHFYRSFKEAFGISPHQYIMNKRMEQSLLLLKEQKFLITDIAYQVGFNDISSFSKCFKKYFRISPGKVYPGSA